MNDNAQTPFDRFVVHILYKQVCNKHGESRTDEAYALVYLTYMVTVEGVTNTVVCR